MPTNMMEILDGVGSAFSPTRLARAYFDSLVVDWGNANIAAGASVDGSIRNPHGTDFIITSQQLVAWTPNAAGGAIAGTPFIDAATPIIGSNTWYSYTLLDVSMRINTRQVGSNRPVAASLLFRGDNGGAVRLTEAQPVLANNEELFITLVNNSPIAIRAEALFMGIVVPS